MDYRTSREDLARTADGRGGGRSVMVRHTKYAVPDALALLGSGQTCNDSTGVGTVAGRCPLITSSLPAGLMRIDKPNLAALFHAPPCHSDPIPHEQICVARAEGMSSHREGSREGGSEQSKVRP